MEIGNIISKNLGSSGATQLNEFQKDIQKTQKFSDTLNKAIETKDEKELKKACVEFESYFLNMLFKSMRKTITPGMKKSNAEETFQEMLDQQMCQKMAKSGGIGFADMMYNQISKSI